MEEQIHLQEILGTDKSNPVFTLSANPELPGKIYVFFGMALLEVVDDDSCSATFKLLLARLYNARVKPQHLIETFSVSYTSLCRWGEALKSGDDEKLISVLAGRQHPRKLTPEILSFSKNRFSAIYPDNHYSYSKVIRQEILDTFDVTICGESLRPHFAQWIHEISINTAVINGPPDSSSHSTESPQVHENTIQEVEDSGEDIESADHDTDGDIQQTRQRLQSVEFPQRVESALAEQSPDSIVSNNMINDKPLLPDNEELENQHDADKILAITAQEAVDENNRDTGQVLEKMPLYNGSEQHNRKHAVISGATATPQIMPLSGGYQFCHHAGVLLFSGFLNELKGTITIGAQLITQWLAVILLGAVNIEQTKLLNQPSLARFLGQSLPNRHQQRQGLAEIAETPCLEELLKLNGQWVGIHQCRDFYYDPHSKHYTGANKLLKGWCSRLRFAEKVLHMDFIHMPGGAPVYLSHDDNYLDLRERFFDVVGQFRSLFSFAPSTPLTFVIDRGIYGLETFEKFLADDAENHFITWEKGFCADNYQDLEWGESMSLYRTKNSSKDVNRYHFSYCDERWSRNNDIRRIVVEATNAKGRSIIVSILCSELHRCAKEIITLMFDRWVQENDFKYLDEHFGINEITSYANLSYKDIEGQLNDRKEKSGLYKALEKQRIQIKSKLKTLLLNEHCAKNDSQKREDKIALLTQQLDDIEEKMAHTEKEVSRLETLAEAGFQKLDTAKKSIMDGVKILARNVFYDRLRPFKDAYDNHRDDHVLFRNLTRSPGLIRETGEGTEVILIPQACFPPKVTNIIHSLLETLNHSQPCVPDGTGRRVTISLLDNGKELIEVLPPQTAKEESKPGRVAIASDHAEHRRLQADTWL
jgi:hypothetical protein